MCRNLRGSSSYTCVLGRHFVLASLNHTVLPFRKSTNPFIRGNCGKIFVRVLSPLDSLQTIGKTIGNSIWSVFDTGLIQLLGNVLGWCSGKSSNITREYFRFHTLIVAICLVSEKMKLFLFVKHKEKDLAIPAMNNYTSSPTIIPAFTESYI